MYSDVCRGELSFCAVFRSLRSIPNLYFSTFSPSPLITNVTLTLSESSRANDSGFFLLKAVREGKMDSTLEDASEHFQLSPAGFEMKSEKGESLLCHPEVNFETSWDLTMYDALDRQPCPRMAQGEFVN